MTNTNSRRARTRRAPAASEQRTDTVTPRTPVVAYIESGAALSAALWAAEQCARTGAALHLVACVEDGTLQQRVPASLLRHVAAAVADRVPGIEIITRLLDGAPAAALITVSADARLIVIADADSAQGRSDVRAVSWALASHGQCPLVLWRASTDGGLSSPVVVGVDGSQISGGALEFALDEASWRQVPLVVVMAWSDVYLDVQRHVVGVITDWRAVAEDSRRMLAEQLAGAREHYPDLDIEQVLTHDRPVRALLKEAANAQLLVVGSHGRGGFPDMLLGSVSRALIDYAPCPLAVVRPSVLRHQPHDDQQCQGVVGQRN